MKCGFLPGECIRKVAGSKLCSKFCRQKLSKPVQRKPNSTKKTWRLTYPFSELNILSTSSILEFTLYLVKGFWFSHFTDKFSIVKDKQASNVGQKNLKKTKQNKNKTNCRKKCGACWLRLRFSVTARRLGSMEREKWASHIQLIGKRGHQLQPILFKLRWIHFTTKMASKFVKTVSTKR